MDAVYAAFAAAETGTAYADACDDGQTIDSGMIGPTAGIEADSGPWWYGWIRGGGWMAPASASVVGRPPVANESKGSPAVGPYVPGAAAATATLQGWIPT